MSDGKGEKGEKEGRIKKKKQNVITGKEDIFSIHRGEEEKSDDRKERKPHHGKKLRCQKRKKLS